MGVLASQRRGSVTAFLIYNDFCNAEDRVETR
jgi:hypothetical protein